MRQLELIEKLTAFIDHLKKTLISCSSSSTKIKPMPEEPKILPRLLQYQFIFKKVNFVDPSFITSAFQTHSLSY